MYAGLEGYADVCMQRVVHACHNALEDTICESVMINPDWTRNVQPDASDVRHVGWTWVGGSLVRQHLYNSSCTDYNGLEMTFHSHAPVHLWAQIPVFPETPLVFWHELQGRLRTGFLVVSFYELHVYS
jgi:hypothetical protein